MKTSAFALWFRAGARIVALAAFAISPAPSCAAAPAAAPPAAAPANSASPVASASLDWAERVRLVRAPDLVDRFLEASRIQLGVPYVNGPLGEGDGASIDSDPRIDWAGADCVTFLEQSLALALAAPRREADFLPILDAIRYADGEVGFATRNHYMMRDWVPANDWLVDDVTEVVGAGRTRTVKKTIDRAAFLKGQGAEPRPGIDDASTLEFAAIPTSQIAAAGDALRAGDLLLWVARKDGIDIAHTGMVVRDPKSGSLLHRHASLKAGKVIEESLLDYAKRAGFAEGVVVLRVKPEAAPAGLAGDD